MPPFRRRTVLLASAVAVIAIGIGAAWFLPPLGTGSAGVASGPPGSDKGSDTTSRASLIWFVPAGRVAFGVEVRNTTFVPVTIAGLVDGTAGFLLDNARLVVGEGPIFGLDDDQTRPFEPFSLRPGEKQLIGVVGWFPDCAHARPRWSTGTGERIASLRLDVRVAGALPAEADVPLIQVVELRGDDEEACSKA